MERTDEQAKQDSRLAVALAAARSINAREVLEMIDRSSLMQSESITKQNLRIQSLGAVAAAADLRDDTQSYQEVFAA